MDLRERRRRDTRLEINRAALELFEKQGVAATTVDEIAQAAGVSASTFFRHFKTKEESILGVDLDFDAEIDAWLADTDPSAIDLAGFEAIYQRAAVRLVEASSDLRDRVLRTRRLIVGDTHLQATAIALDVTKLHRLTDIVAARVAGRETVTYVRLMLESAGMTLRIAFDDWATRIDAGEDPDLAEIYAATRAEFRRVTG